jgi:hypothetical protein
LRQWIGVNAFFLAIILTACGVFFVLFSLLRSLHLEAMTERYFAVVVVFITLIVTYYVGGALHGFVERRLFGTRR